MPTYTSISDFLEAHGYKAEGERYVKRKDSQVTMWVWPEDWAGLTVDAFIQKAREKGWVEEEHVTKAPLFAVEDRERQEEVFRISDFYLQEKETEDSLEYKLRHPGLRLPACATEDDKIPTILDLKNEIIRSLKRELHFADLHLADFNKLLEMIPECPVHQFHCLHYAQEWVAKMKEHDTAQSTQNVLVVRKFPPDEEIAKWWRAEEAKLIFPASPHSDIIPDVHHELTIEFTDDCYGKNIPLYWELRNDFLAKRQSHFHYEGKEYDMYVTAVDEYMKRDYKFVRFTLRENRKD